MKASTARLKQFGARAWDVTEALTYLLLILVFATLCPYLIGFSANSVPEMQPVLLLATIGVLAYFSCAVSEKLLLSFGRPPFPVSEKFRKRAFITVTLLSVISFAAVLDVATFFDIVGAFQVTYQALEGSADSLQAASQTLNESGGAGAVSIPPATYHGIIFILLQPLYLAFVFWRAKKSGMRRTSFLSIMLIAVFIGYPISAFAGEFAMGMLLLLAAVIAIPIFLIALALMPVAFESQFPSERRRYW